MVVKSIFDRVVSLIALLFLSPVFLFVALLIKIDSSSGPVFFRQERIGKGGRLFWIFKFRSMVPNASEVGPQITPREDRRITKVGRLLRRYKLDELPQLLNVLKGEMSFVGPRPEVPKFAQKYSIGDKKVLSVKPGITDLATLYYRNESELIQLAEGAEEYYCNHILPRKLALNRFYIERQNLVWDIVILGMTVLVSLCPKFFGKKLGAMVEKRILSNLT